MSIVGVTIDYGPYGFMDRYDPGFICNGSDDSGRYAYKQQPTVCRWNCGKLAESLAPLLPMQKSKPILDTFDEEYERVYITKMRQKVQAHLVPYRCDASIVSLVWSHPETIGCR
jgi:serine/tyrosine/threonine adenylyltransferase